MNLRSSTSCAVLLALAACSSTKEAEPAAPQPVTVPQVESLAGEPDIERNLETLILSTRRHLGRKEVRIRLHNSASSAIRFAYALEWKDRRGDIIGGYHHDWTPLDLDAGQSVVLTIQGPTPAAETWRLHAKGIASDSEEPDTAPSTRNQE